MPEDEQQQTSDDNTPGTPPPAAFTQDDVERVVRERLTRERDKYRDYADLKVKAARLQELEDAEKTAQQRAADEVAAARREVEQAKADATRFRAAAVHRIGEADMGLLGDGSEEQVMARAERLGALLAAETELAELKKQQDGKTQQQGRPQLRAWQPGASSVEVNAGPSAKERAAAQARAMWGESAVGGK